MDRRTFLRASAGAAVVLPERILADPYAPLLRRRPASAAIRVRGRVTTGGRGVAGVSITDGRDVVATASDGTYELISDDGRPFVHLAVPSGHRIPVGPSGTARFYHPLRAGARGEMEASWDLVPLDAPDDRHALLLLADPQTQDEEEMALFHSQTVPDVVETVRGLGGVETVAVACGDIMYDDLALYPEYERGVARMGVPFFQVVGNHDLDQDAATDLASTNTFTERFGPRYYAFDRGEVHYVVLDDVFWFGRAYMGYLEQDQLTWLANDLARIEAGRTVIVCTHIPSLGGSHVRHGREEPDYSVSIPNREALYRLLEPYHAHILVGHTHESEHVFEHGVHEHVHGTVCGAWWTGPICWDGTPNGYAVYEIDGGSVTWRYKATGHPAEHQMRLYPPGADPERPERFLANVWDWDPEWRVVWYEDGNPRGSMEQGVGRDPLSVQLHAGPDLPRKRTWVDPELVAHLFSAEPSPRAGRVTVEATDRLGRVYTETLSLTDSG